MGLTGAHRRDAQYEVGIWYLSKPVDLITKPAYCRSPFLVHPH